MNLLTQLFQGFTAIAPETYFICLPLVGLAGFVDAIGGGGGLISLPAYVMAGLPPHTAIATNKMSSTCGTALATGRFIKAKLVDFKLALPAVITAMAGSYLGSNISMLVDDAIMRYVLIIFLPVIAFLVLNKHIFYDREDNKIMHNKRTYFVVLLIAFMIGLYDGFYGPGTGTLLIIAFTIFVHMSVRTANGLTKVINLTTNATALAVFLMHGQVLLPLGIAAAICNMIGGYLGAGMVMKSSTKIVKPVIVFVITLLLVTQIKELIV